MFRYIRSIRRIAVIDSRDAQELSLYVAFHTNDRLQGSEILAVVRPHAQRLLSEVPLSDVHTAEFVNGKSLWLDEYTKPRLRNAQEVVLQACLTDHVYPHPSDLLLSRRMGDPFFPALRTLSFEGLSVANLDADELYELLCLQPVPIEDMTVVFTKCHNLNRGEIAKLAGLVRVREEP